MEFLEGGSRFELLVRTTSLENGVSETVYGVGRPGTRSRES